MNQGDRSQLKKTKFQDDFWKPWVLTVIAFILADWSAKWISVPLAAGLVVLLLGSLSYWIPPKPKMVYSKWILRMTAYAALTFALAGAYKLVRSQFGN